MNQHSMNVPTLTIGLDLGDRKSHFFALKHDGEIIAEGKVSTSKTALRKKFEEFEPARVVIEAGSQSHWVSQLLDDIGHEVIVANPRQAAALAGKRKNDRLDAQSLARTGRVDIELLAPIRHRGPDAQLDLCLIRSRCTLVRVRAQLVTHARSTAKTFGQRIKNCSTPAFADKAPLQLSAELQLVLRPVFETIALLTEQIKLYDRKVKALCKNKYPETARLMAIKGVGPLVALTYVLTIEDPDRFLNSRDVGAYLGLVPGLHESGNRQPELRISKAGDGYLRNLLINAAHYILGPFGQDCDLREHGMRICRGGGKNAKKRAVVAVGRKLSVLLHRLWTHPEPYDPLYNRRRKAPVRRRKKHSRSA